ncbi:hypothetical protein D9611_005978 [Ephemerocybe angulata]|uniref:Uncharacterized protein n=1 Tax=Ephemerocybe angulata TaxID=980116 RepID=A0A8H5FLE2_9AGAR|nr:hypothetical protein D9611_005978 [Tulosesus angulatus]
MRGTLTLRPFSPPSDTRTHTATPRVDALDEPPCKTRQTREIVGTARQFETTRIEAFPAPPNDVLDVAFRALLLLPSSASHESRQPTPSILSARFAHSSNYVLYDNRGRLQLAQRRRDSQHDDPGSFLQDDLVRFRERKLRAPSDESSTKHPLRRRGLRRARQNWLARWERRMSCSANRNTGLACICRYREWLNLYPARVSNSHPSSLRPYARTSSCDALCAVQDKIWSKKQPSSGGKDLPFDMARTLARKVSRFDTITRRHTASKMAERN